MRAEETGKVGAWLEPMRRSPESFYGGGFPSVGGARRVHVVGVTSSLDGRCRLVSGEGPKLVTRN